MSTFSRLLERPCTVCGTVYRPSRSDSRTCSDRCRQQLSRDIRARVVTDAAATRDAPRSAWREHDPHDDDPDRLYDPSDHWSEL